MSANLHSRQNHCSRKHEIPEVPEFSFLPDCRACRKRGVPGFLPVWLPCKNLGTGCFWRYLTVNYLQLAQVRKSMFLRRPKNRLFRKYASERPARPILQNPLFPGFYIVAGQPSLPTNSAIPTGALSFLPSSSHSSRNGLHASSFNWGQFQKLSK